MHSTYPKALYVVRLNVENASIISSHLTWGFLRQVHLLDLCIIYSVSSIKLLNMQLLNVVVWGLYAINLILKLLKPIVSAIHRIN